MKKILIVFFVCLSVQAIAQDEFSNAGIRIGTAPKYNWRIYRSSTGDLNQSLLFANVGGTDNLETIRFRLTHWGGLSLGGTTINSSDKLSVNGQSRFAGTINMPLLSGGSGQIRMIGEASDYAYLKAEPYGSGSGSRLRFQVGDNIDDYFSFFHSDHALGAKEMMQLHRSQLWLKDSDLIIDNINNKGLQLVQNDSKRYGKVFITQETGTGSGTGNTMLFEVGNDYGAIYNQRIVFRSAGTDRMVVEHDGNVGVGTTSPDARLTVNGGDLQVSNMGHFKGWTTSGLTGVGLDIGVSGDVGHLITYDRTNSLYKSMRLAARGGAHRGLYISKNGNFGMDVSAPTHKLEVNGNIRAKEILVEASPWPDYVFGDEYRLMPLEEVKAYIEKEGHLPNIPSAVDVETNGLAVGEMNTKLMEKVEELTLYTIELQEKMKAQQKLIDTLIEKFDKSTEN